MLINSPNRFTRAAKTNKSRYDLWFRGEENLVCGTFDFDPQFHVWKIEETLLSFGERVSLFNNAQVFVRMWAKRRLLSIVKGNELEKTAER